MPFPLKEAGMVIIPTSFEKKGRLGSPFAIRGEGEVPIPSLIREGKWPSPPLEREER